MLRPAGSMTREYIVLAALLLAAGLSSLTPARGARPQPFSAIDRRITLLEAKEILQSKQIWTLYARLQPEALKALEDVHGHLVRDQEQEERVRVLTAEVQSLSQRVASLELLLRGSIPEGNLIPVAPTVQEPAPPPKPKPSAKNKKRKRRAAPRAIARAP